MRPLSKLLSASPLKAWSIPGFWPSGADDDGTTWFPSLSTATSWMADREEIEHWFEGYVEGAYKRNGIVFACILARLLPFSEARFQFQHLIDGRPGDLFSGPSLSLLERPWPNGSTGELLARMEQDASMAGNFYATPVGEGLNRRLRRLRPDWVKIVSGVRGDIEASPFDLQGEVLGYIYEPRHNGASQSEPILLTPERVVHYSPIPDPLAQWRGMSWLTPVVREIEADSATTKHKLKFFENGGTPSYVIKYADGISPATFERYVALFNEQHKGVDNAYKILHIGGGADPVPVGADLRQLDFKATQGAGETRIAAAAGVGAIIARLSEGMQGSALNTGNYQAAKRQFADMTIRPLWRLAAGSLAKLVDVPNDARLWFDDRDIAFLKEDQKDAAAIQTFQADTIVKLVQAGATWDSAIAAVEAGDFTLLKDSGMRSVQLQGAGGESDPAKAARELVEMVQKVYLGVGTVLTAVEARNILNRAGAGLSDSFDPIAPLAGGAS